jgi:hypothetical protein
MRVFIAEIVADPQYPIPVPGKFEHSQVLQRYRQTALAKSVLN